MINAHFSPVDMDDAFSKKVFESYIKSLDGQKRYFLQSDINEFKKYETLLDDNLKKGDISFFNLSYERLKQRMKEAEAITKAIFAILMKTTLFMEINLQTKLQTITHLLSISTEV